MASSKYKKDIIRLRKEGKSYNKIEEKLGCSKSTISYHCEKEGLQDIGLKNKKVPKNVQKNLNEFYKEHTLNETVKEFGVCGSTVIKYSDVDKDWQNITNSILNISSRTRSKVLRRLISEENLSCSRCGWDEAIGDIHHINGRDIEDPHRHSNLSYLCPNCHRLFHIGKITVDEIESFEVQVGKRWKEYYYSIHYS